MIAIKFNYRMLSSASVIDRSALIFSSHRESPTATSIIRPTCIMRSLLVVLLLSGSVRALSSSLPPLARTAEHLPLANEALSYLDESTDPFHAVQTSIDLLEKAGFVSLDDGGDISPGGKYYFTRNKSTLVAYTVGAKYMAGNGFKIIGGHTDSPNLRVKPRSKRAASGCIQLGVECYGGGLWHTWFDRDLGISGRVMVRNADGGITQKLVKIDRPLLRISNLAIHLRTAKEREAFEFNKEDHLSPILAMEAQKALSGDSTEATTTKDGWTEYQEPALLSILANEIGMEVCDIVDFELSLFDIQKASIGGGFSEFLYSARLDNLASCFLAVKAMVDHVAHGNVDTDDDIAMVVLYDHEVRSQR